MAKGVSRFCGALLSAFLFAAPMAFGASIGLVPSYPDQATFNANYSFSFDPGLCQNKISSNAPSEGVCDTQNLSGNPNNQYDYTGAYIEGTGGGTLEITDGLMAINIDGLGSQPILGGDYQLTAYFDVSGNILSASISVLGTVDQSFGGDPGSEFQSGILGQSSSLVDFGFSGINANGTFEFVFDNAVGDMVDYAGGNYLFVIASASLSQLSSFGNWDPLNDGDTTLFTQSFSGTGQVNTFVPLPASGVFFISALAAIAGLRVRKAL